jgi:drug/metabolite transporter (DMT)-like permease
MSFLNFPPGLKQVVAAGIVNLGDVVVAGARPIANNLNFASATGSGSATTATLTVAFTTPLPSATYKIDLTFVSVVAGNSASDASIVWAVQSQSATGFVLMFRETVGVGQNVSADIECTVRTP